eukprot:g30697.t1
MPRRRGWLLDMVCAIWQSATLEPNYLEDHALVISANSAHFWPPACELFYHGKHSVLQESWPANPGKPLIEVPAVSGGNSPQERMYKVSLVKTEGQKLGLDVDYMAERSVLPILVISGGIAEQWNRSHPERKMNTGDSIVEVNGIRGNVALMLEKCKVDATLELTICKCLTYGHLVADLEKLISIKGCGPIMVRLSWHDAGVFNGVDGCPNAAMRLAGGGEYAFGANAGLQEAQLYCVHRIALFLLSLGLKLLFPCSKLSVTSTFQDLFRIQTCGHWLPTWQSRSWEDLTL